MSLSRKEIFGLLLAITLCLIAVVPHVARAVGNQSDLFCATQYCYPGKCVPSPKDPKCVPCATILCRDVTSGFITSGNCVSSAPGVCKATGTSGKDGFGLDQVAKILGDLMGKLMQGGKDSGQQNNPTPTTPPQAPTCNISNSIVSANASSTTVRLSWQAYFYTSTGGADTAGSVSISPQVGSVETSGTRDVTVSDVTTFTMSVSGSGGSANCSTTVIGLGGGDTGPCNSIFGCTDDGADDITATPRSGAAPLTVSFSASVKKAGTYIIDFGDDTALFEISLMEGRCTDGTNFGACSLQVDVRHVFEKSGVYPVRLRSALEADALDSVTITVQGGTATSSGLSASPVSGVAPLTVTFSHRVTGQTGGATMSYGDGASEAATLCPAPTDFCTSPGTNTHVYNTPGTYTARLTKTCAAGSTNCTSTEYGAATITVTASTTATTTKPVPTFTNPTFLLPGPSGDIQVLKDGGTVFATMRDPSKNTQISGFIGSNTFNLQPQSIVGRLCQARPWAVGFLTYIVPPTFFDGLCSSRGYQVGLSANPITTTPVVIVTQTQPTSNTPAVTPAVTKSPATSTSTASSANSRVRVWAVPATVPIGSRTSIFWTSQSVSNCTVSSPDGAFMQTSLSGGASTVPITSATTFTISCLAPDGTPITGYTTVTISI